MNKMAVLEYNHVCTCDIDSTLIMHVEPAHELPDSLVSVIDPMDPTKIIQVLPNEPMIRILREELAAGYLVIVWSKGRYEWARAVLKALKISHKNIVIMSKPTHYMDDRPCEEWMGPRIYLPPDQIYKNRG